MRRLVHELNLSPEDKSALIAFLKTLEWKRRNAEHPAARPWPDLRDAYNRKQWRRSGRVPPRIRSE
jgi:hypothetical protein